MSTDCKITPSNGSAYCVGAVISEGTTSSITEVVPIDGLAMPVTLTDGLEKLPAATGSPTAPANTDAITTPAPTGTGAPTGNSDENSDENSGENSEDNDESTGEPETTSTSTAGVARITQNAVVLGAAALVGGAMFM
jgi:hypothetical protein